MKNKKGSHVGAVISFVVFILFITFIYAITQPIVRSSDKENVLERVKIGVFEESSTDLTRVSIAFSSPPGTDLCTRLDDFFSSTGMSKKVIVIDSSGDRLTAVQSGDDLFITRKDVDDYFFWIYESEEFNETSIGSPSCPSEVFNIGLLKSNKMLFESKIIELINKSLNDYDGLKNNMGLSQGINFGLSFTYSDGTTITTGPLPASNIDIYAEELHIQYVNTNALIEQALFNIRIW